MNGAPFIGLVPVPTTLSLVPPKGVGMWMRVSVILSLCSGKTGIFYGAGGMRWEPRVMVRLQF